MNDAWKSDPEYREETITKVRETATGWEISHDSMGFFVTKESPVVPADGMVVRYYGRGFGHSVRGLLLDGTPVFYRTEEEDTAYHETQMYGASCEELLERWDAGRGVWSVEMGGIGPGYEQCIQIAAFEVLRYMVEHKPDGEEWGDVEKYRKFRDAMEKAVMPKLEPLGLSGAQWGAATNIAAVFYRKGPVEAIKSAPKDRHIQVSKRLPQLAEG